MLRISSYFCFYFGFMCS